MVSLLCGYRGKFCRMKSQKSEVMAEVRRAGPVPMWGRG